VSLLPRFVVLFDGACPLCRRTVAMLRALDWFGRLTFADATDDVLRHRYAPGLERAAALSEMYVVDAEGNRTAGFDGYLRLSSGVLVLWIPRWIGLVPPVTWLGRWLYRVVAARRARQGGCTDDICAPGATRPL